MTTTKAQQKAVNKYVKNNYDQVRVLLPKGMKDEVKEHAAHNNESVNAYITRAIKEAFKLDIM